MPFPLPPKDKIRSSTKEIAHVHEVLTSEIAGHAKATTTFLFYEDLDAWLGPWGEAGYPISYGKFYNVAFSNNARLMANPVTRNWVWNTTILLQEALRDFIVKRVRAGTLAKLTEAELREAAFATHPKAYVEGGLTRVAAIAPELLPVVATIPSAEFSPRAANFGATVAQVIKTAVMLVPSYVSMLGMAVAASNSGPHMGFLLGHATAMDTNRLLMQQQLARTFGLLETAVRRGQVDDIATLVELNRRIANVQLPDQGFTMQVRSLTAAIDARIGLLRGDLKTLLDQSPEVKQRVLAAFPTVLGPTPLSPRAFPEP